MHVITLNFYYLENIKDKRELIEVKFKNVKDEIDKRVETLINQVNKMGDKLRTNLEDIRKKTLKYFLLIF